MRLHTVSDYFVQRSDQFEALEQFVTYAYSDSRGIATIGVGLNLAEHGLLVLEMLGFDFTGTVLSGQAEVAEQKYIADLLDAFSVIRPADSGPNNAARAAIQLIVEARGLDAAGDYAAFAEFQRVEDFLLVEAQAFALLNVLLDTGYSIQPPTGLTKTVVAFEEEIGKRSSNHVLRLS
jgi:hypothetical protein